MSSISDTLRTLFSHAEDQLSQDELGAMSSLVEQAGHEAGRLSNVCSALAALVLSDGEGATPSGDFQHPSNTFELLCNLSLSLDAISGMVETGLRARDCAQTLQEKGGVA